MNPYLKLIPKEKHKEKTGMNICIVCDYNIAGQLTRLMRAINKYSPHKARCIILRDDYMSYDRDVILIKEKWVLDLSLLYSEKIRSPAFLSIGIL